MKTITQIQKKNRKHIVEVGVEMGDIGEDMFNKINFDSMVISFRKSKVSVVLLILDQK